MTNSEENSIQSPHKPLKVLTIGYGRDLFDTSNENAMRMKKQAQMTSGMHAIVFTKMSDGLVSKKVSERLVLHPTNSKSKWSYLVDAFTIGSRLLKDRGDEQWVVSSQDPFETGVVAMLLKKKFGVPFHMQEHGDFFNDPYWRKESVLNKLRAYAGRKVMKYADSVRVVSERMKKPYLDAGIAPEKILAFPVRTEIERWLCESPSENIHERYPNHDVVILTAARFVQQKHLPMMLRAFSRVVSGHKTALLLMVGSGPLENALKHQVTELGIEDNVKFIPWADDVISLFKTSDIYVLSSNYEGWGRVLIEAMASGIPIVTTDVGLAGEVLKDGEAGFVVPIGDEDAFVTRLRLLVEDKKMRTDMGLKGREVVRKLPSAEQSKALYRRSWDIAIEQFMTKDKGGSDAS